jgi:hypothetical protein
MIPSLKPSLSTATAGAPSGLASWDKEMDLQETHQTDDNDLACNIPCNAARSCLEPSNKQLYLVITTVDENPQEGSATTHL